MTARSYRTSSGGESPRRKQNSVARQRAGATDTTTGGKRPRWDSNPRITDLQSVPLVHLGTRPAGHGIVARGSGEATGGNDGHGATHHGRGGGRFAGRGGGEQTAARHKEWVRRP